MKYIFMFHLHVKAATGLNGYAVVKYTRLKTDLSDHELIHSRMTENGVSMGNSLEMISKQNMLYIFLFIFIDDFKISIVKSSSYS